MMQMKRFFFFFADADMDVQNPFGEWIPSSGHLSMRYRNQLISVNREVLDRLMRQDQQSIVCKVKPWLWTLMNTSVCWRARMVRHCSRAAHHAGFTHCSLRASFLIGFEGSVKSNHNMGVQTRIYLRETCQIWSWPHWVGEGRRPQCFNFSVSIFIIIHHVLILNGKITLPHLPFTVSFLETEYWFKKKK